MVPDFGLGRTPTLAAVTFFAGKMFKSQKLRHTGILLAGAAAYQFGHDRGTAKK